MTNEPRRALSAFLRAQKEAYLRDVREQKGGSWVVSTGNEAGDLDSIASAIAYAWFASEVQNNPTVALAQTPRPDLHLRAENLHALALANLDLNSDILCIDDIPQSTPFPSTKFALLDHNRLQSRFSRDNPEARVVAVVDHHEDEGLYRDTADPRLVVVPTGSCASLVARLLQPHADRIPPELAGLLLCSVLIDTSGLKPGGKAEDADREAAAFLLPRTTLLSQSPPSALDASKLYENDALRELNRTLQEKKASVDHLNTRDHLRRDYKEYTMRPQGSSCGILVGLSSAPIGFTSWMPHHADFWELVEAYMQERNLGVLGILTSFRDDRKTNKHGKPKHRREQMYIVRDDAQLAASLFDGLEAREELRLKRAKFTDYGVKKGFGSGFTARVWKQKNVDATRKVTAPLVKNVIEGTRQSAAL